MQRDSHIKKFSILLLANLIPVMALALLSPAQALERSSEVLVVVDKSIEGYQKIAADAATRAIVVLIDAELDGVDQLTTALASYTNLQSLHIVSHGAPGTLRLGSSVLDLATTRNRAVQIRSWTAAFSGEFEILLYGCDVASGGNDSLPVALGEMLGARVAASANRTGSDERGGDWVLEVSTGPIESDWAFGPAVTLASDIVLAIPAGFTDELVLDDLNQPVAIAVLPSGEMLVLERPGKMLITDPATIPAVATTYLQVPDVDSGGERGLLSIALDPDFAVNQHFYVYYHNTTVDRARVSRFVHDTDHAHAADEFVIWEDNIPMSNQIVANHWGGGLGFGPDGYLYLTLGDKSDVPEDSQNLNLTAGKILRFDTSGADSGGGPWIQGSDNPHLVPDSNPFIDGSGRVPDEIWALGLRNPFRAHWDLLTGRFYIGEVGGNIQSGADASHEDIHVVTTVSGGANFGWPNCEGPDCVGPPPPNYSAPLYSIQHPGSRSIVVGPVYRGSLFPTIYNNALFIADTRAAG